MSSETPADPADDAPVALAVFFATLGVGLFTGYPIPFVAGMGWAVVLWFIAHWWRRARDG